MSTGYLESKKYTWKFGTSFPVAAGAAAEAIMDLQTRLGRDDITNKELVDDSRAEDAPLHPCFTWDDPVAAEKWREEEARHIIRSIVVIEPTLGVETLVPVRAFVNVEPVAPGKQGKYVSIDVVVKNDTYRRQVLSNALIELRNFQRKYKTYEELNGVIKAIDDFGDALQ